MVLAKVGRITRQTLCGYFMALEGKRISELTEVSRVNKSSKLPIDTGGEEALSITLENLIESGVNAAIESLQFITWVDVLPPTGSTKYLYAVPREETDTDGKQIAALYLWDGSAWRGAGAFSLNIDPATLATKSELAGYLPLSGGTLSGILKINTGTDDKISLLSNNHFCGGLYANGTSSNPSVLIINNTGQAIGITKGSGVYLQRKIGETGKILCTLDKAVANGVASLDANAKVPENQLPDSVANQAILREW